MQRYRVKSSPLQLLPGEVAELSAAQYAGRASKVEVTKERKSGARVVRVRDTIDFKSGEEIGLPEVLPRRISDLVEPIGDGKLALEA